MIVVGTGARSRQESTISFVSLRSTNVPVSESVRSLEITWDSVMSFDGHVDKICKTAFYHTRALRRIRKFVTIDDSKNIAAAVVGSKLDYCNYLLHGVSEANLPPMHVQTVAS